MSHFSQIVIIYQFFNDKISTFMQTVSDSKYSILTTDDKPNTNFVINV